MAAVGEALRRPSVPVGWATPATLIAAGITLVGLLLRVVYLDEQSLFGDELSTAWVVTGHGLGETIDRVQSDQEITPPLFFVVAWLAAKLGDSTTWLQLPSLFAGTAAIPLVYLLGVRTVGPAAGVVGAALTALNPFLIFYSTEVRAYALLLLLVVLSTLALLAALDTGRRRWWVAYAALSCAALYTQYAGAFALAAQALWVLWAHRESWGPLLVANCAAALCFLPWLPSYFDDSESPTTHILEAIHPFGLELAIHDVARWAVGWTFSSPGTVPGTVGLLLLAAGLAIAIGGLVPGVARTGVRLGGPRVPPRTVLIVVLAVSTPLGAALYSLLGSDVFVPRNLIASWPGLALALGALTVATPLRIASVALVLAAFCIGTVKVLDDDFRRPDYRSVAELIDRTGQPGDPVVDIPAPTGGPITALEATDAEPGRVFVLGGGPRLPGPVEIEEIRQPGLPARSVAGAAIRQADGGRIFVVAPELRPEAESSQPPPYAGVVIDNLPPRFRLVEAERYEGLADLSVYRYEDVGRER